MGQQILITGAASSILALIYEGEVLDCSKTHLDRMYNVVFHYVSISTKYARKFIRLSKYAPHIIPTETAGVKRFRSGLIVPLYNAMLAAEFLTLSKLIDKEK